MNINYLAVLPKVTQEHVKEYTLVDISKESIKSVIEDKINFSNADENYDDFLTYEELANIKLSVNFNTKKDNFELTRGVGLLDNESIENIFSQKGISFYTLEEELKKLDGNKDGKIDSSEVEQDLSQLAKRQERADRAYRLNDIKERSGEQSQNESDKKQIAALEKQIQSLKRVLSQLEMQKASKPQSGNTSNQDMSEHASQSIENKANIKELEAKYGNEEVDNVVNALERATVNSGNVDVVAQSVIAQTNTDISKEEIVTISQGMEAVTMSEISVKEAQDLSAIEQFSPASTPVSIDSKNIEFTMNSIAQKINDLEGMKDKMVQKMMDTQLKKLNLTV